MDTPAVAVRFGPGLDRRRRAAAALGPVAGGLLTALDWRWVFLVNLPVGLLGLLAGPRIPTASPPVGGPRPDLTGAAVSVLPAGSFATGSAVVTMARQVGSVLGVAALVAVLGAAPGTGDFDHGWLVITAATAATGAAALTLLARPAEKIA